MAGSAIASSLAAWVDELTAPASQIANPATEAPSGICTIESRASMPLSAPRSRGTPMTGRSARRSAILPGRWAAPPAQAMITCTDAGRFSICRTTVRKSRCTELICTRQVIPNSCLSVFTAFIISGRSESLPIVTSTRGTPFAAAPTPSGETSTPCSGVNADSISSTITLDRERRPRLLCLLIDVCEILAYHGNMPHLAINPCLTFAIDMHKHVCIVFCPFRFGRAIACPQNIFHHCRRIEHISGTEGKIGNSAQVLCELRRFAGFDGVMPKIVRARRDLVDPDFARFIKEKFDAKDANTIEVCNGLTSNLLRLGLH